MTEHGLAIKNNQNEYISCIINLPLSLVKDVFHPFVYYWGQIPMIFYSKDEVEDLIDHIMGLEPELEPYVVEF